MKKNLVLLFILIFMTISCGKKTEKIIHLKYSSLDTIRIFPLVVNESGGVDQVSVFLTQLTENNLKKSKRFEFIDLNNWALMRDSPNTILKINKIHNESKRAVTFFQNNKMERAFDLSERLLTHLSTIFQFFEDLDEVYYLKSYQAASAILSDVIDAERFFNNIAIMNPKYDFDANKFGPGILKQFKEAKRNVKRNSKKGVITVNSSPVSAKVFIDGLYRGVTPYQSEKIITGKHYIKVEADGYYPHGEIVEVLPQENPVDVNFKPFTINRELNLLRKDLINSIKNKEKLFPKIILKFLRVIPFDQLVLIKTQTVNSDVFVEVFVYDIPTTALYTKGNFKLNIESNNLEDVYYNNLDRILEY
jgi:hypothetical protein